MNDLHGRPRHGSLGARAEFLAFGGVVPSRHRADALVRRMLMVTAVLSLALGGACANEHALDRDAHAAADGGAPHDGAGQDGGPPAQFCPDNLVRRTVANVGDGTRLGSGVGSMRVVSTAHFEVVAASPGLADPTSPHDFQVWAVERATGAVASLLLLHGSLLATSALADAEGATFIACDFAGTTCQRIRWDEGAPAARAEEGPAELARATLARRDATQDVAVRVLEGPTRLERWIWPVDGAPSSGTITGDGLSDLSSGTYYSHPRVAPSGDGVAVAVMIASEGRLVWLDHELSSIVSAATFRGEALPTEGGLESLGDGALALALLTTIHGAGGDTEALNVFRVAPGAFDPMASVRAPFVQWASAGDARGAYFAGTSNGLGQLGGDGVSADFFLAHVTEGPLQIAGGERSILTGACFAIAMTVPPEGGVIVASSCGALSEVSLTYACVPGVW